MHPAANSGVFALGVLAHDDPVEFVAVDVSKRGRDPRQHAGRAHVRVLIEGLTDGKAQAPQGNVVGNVRMACRAKQNRVVLADHIPAILGHHAAVLLVVLAAPIEMIDLERKAAIPFGDCGQDLDAGRDHLPADTVARDRRDCVGFHVSMPPGQDGRRLRAPGTANCVQLSCL